MVVAQKAAEQKADHSNGLRPPATPPEQAPSETRQCQGARRIGNTTID
jgi:hypothetical protein